jgi:alpha-glucosidase
MSRKLDYLQDLGVDAIWLSPHFPSPQVDVGYDISDYLGVAEEYGTLADFKAFLDGAHRRGMRVVLDLVLNHTSDQHDWFKASRSGKDNSKRNWYVWRDGRDGRLPNNWWSAFGGPAWEYDEDTRQYYYHFFFKEQPDLNWRNPDVRKAMGRHTFLLDGVDGFRLDAIGTIFEHPRYINSPAKRTQAELQIAYINAKTDEERQQLEKESEQLYKYQVELPEVQDLMRDLRRVVDKYPDRMLVGEDDRIAYYGDGTDMLHLVFNFPLMNTDRITPAWVRANQRSRLGALPPGAWPCNTLGNHDTPRLYSRYGDGKHDAQIARSLLALILTLRHAVFDSNGEEIGMTDLLLSDPDQFRDNLGTYAYQIINQIGLPPDEALKIAIHR